jgi:hypothetical protein
MVTNVFVNDHLASHPEMKDLVGLIRKRGYQVALSDPSRAALEWATNEVHALSFLQDEYVMGTAELAKIIAGGQDISMQTLEDAAVTMKMTQLDRAFGSSKGGKFTEQGAISRVSTSIAGKVIDGVNDNLITMPDRVVVMRIWVGATMSKFKKLTGEKIDFKKIAEKDRVYLDKYKDAIRETKKYADNMIEQSVTSKNPMEAIPRMIRSHSDEWYNAVYKNFNSFFTSFPIGESISMYDAYNGIFKGGYLGVRKGISLATATMARMTIYSMYIGIVPSLTVLAVMSAMGLGGDEEKEKKLKKEADPTTDEGRAAAARAFVGSALAIGMGKKGNIVRSFANFGIEQANKKWGHDLGLRTSEKYEFGDELMFSIVPVNYDGRETKINEDALKTGYALSAWARPLIEGSVELVNVIYEKSNKTTSTYNKAIVHQLTIKKNQAIIDNKKSSNDEYNTAQRKIATEKKALEKLYTTYGYEADKLGKKTTRNAFNLFNATAGFPAGKFVARVLTERYVRSVRNNPYMEESYINEIRKIEDGLKNIDENDPDYKWITEQQELRKKNIVMSLEDEITENEKAIKEIEDFKQSEEGKSIDAEMKEAMKDAEKAANELRMRNKKIKETADKWKGIK